MNPTIVLGGKTFFIRTTGCYLYQGMYNGAAEEFITLFNLPPYDPKDPQFPGQRRVCCETKKMTKRLLVLCCSRRCLKLINNRATMTYRQRIIGQYCRRCLCQRSKIILCLLVLIARMNLCAASVVADAEIYSAST